MIYGMTGTLRRPQGVDALSECFCSFVLIIIFGVDINPLPTLPLAEDCNTDIVF